MAEAKSPLVIRGFHGMGDCLHMRAVVRQLMQRHDVWLETSWPCIYDDMIAAGLKVLRRSVSLRTQTKNANRPSEVVKFSQAAPPGIRSIGVAYNGRSIGSTPSKTILETLCAGTGCDFTAADFRMPIPPEWIQSLPSIINRSGKPLMVYRPLTARPEWAGGAVRNANEAQYAELLAAIRDDFFVVSVADLVPGREWIVGPKFKADVVLHRGELVFEQLAALFSRADLVFTSGGFGTLLAMAVETPVVSIIGGYERASWASAGARFSPFLGIEPIEPCSCGTSCGRYCTKVLDMPVATAKLREFCVRNMLQIGDTPRTPMAEMFDPAETAERPRLSVQQLQLQRAMISRSNTGMRA